MKKKDMTVLYTPSQVKNMINARDFSDVEGNVPNFISFLLKSSPTLLKSSLDVALENKNILKETQEYIHKTSEKVIKEYTAIANLEQQSLANTNKDLGRVLVSLSKKDQMSPNEIDVYFQTLQEIERNNVRMDENRKQSEHFLVRVQENEHPNTQPKEYIVAKAVLNVLKTPQGAKLATETLAWLAKSLYKAYTKQ